MLIYDLEIINAVPPRDGLRQSNVTYCEGWHDYVGMGIAVICCYDYKTDRTRVFSRDNISLFPKLVETHDVVVGFNNSRFDNRVLAANMLAVPEALSYDLLTEIWRGLGLSDEFNFQTHGGYSLDAMCQANFRTGKVGNGADAPLAFQRGNIGQVIDYCLHDVHLTKRLLDRVIRQGTLVDPKNPNQPIRVRKPGAH